jgi:large subunit ribosomal protein L32e
MNKKFLKRGWNRDFKLGKRKRKKRVWKKPKGRHNKMREKRRGYAPIVRIGYKNTSKNKTVIVRNINDLLKIKNNELAILGKIGKRKKIEIIKKAIEKKIKIKNLNLEKFLNSKLNNKEKKKNES